MVNDRVEKVEDDYLVECPVPGRSPELDQRVAVHESFHAICARLLGWPLGSVTIDPGETYEGRVTGPRYSATRSKGDIIDASTVANVLLPIMPLPGEDRGAVADVFQSVLDQCVVMLAGEVGERILLPGDPQPAVSDRRQAAELASLICKSPEAVQRLIALAETMADDLLRPHGYIGIEERRGKGERGCSRPRCAFDAP